LIEPRKATSLRGRRRKTHIVKICSPMRPVRVSTKETKKDKEKPYSGHLDIRRDHPRRLIEIKLREVAFLGSYKFQVSSKSVKRSMKCGERGRRADNG